MDVFNIFNKASEKLNSYFSFIENKIKSPKKEIQDSLIQINSKIFIWIKDTNFKDDEFIKVPYWTYFSAPPPSPKNDCD